MNSGDWPKHPAHPSNVPGLFYVKAGECLLCMAPQGVAPDLIGESPDSCYFKKQPQSGDEIQRTIKAVETCCVGAYRYSGTDPAIIQKLVDAGLADACDALPEQDEWAEFRSLISRAVQALLPFRKGNR